MCDHDKQKVQTSKVQAPRPYVFNYDVGVDVIDVSDAAGAVYNLLSAVDIGTTYQQAFIVRTADRHGVPSSNACLKAFHKGWIPDVFSDLPETEWSFVHIDVDLYEPTLAAFQYFFPRLSTGGIIICDDYSYSLFPGAKLAVDEFISSIVDECIFHPFSIGGCMIIKN